MSVSDSDGGRASAASTQFPTTRAEWDALDAERSEKLRELWATERQINHLLRSVTPMREEIARLDILLDVVPDENDG